MTAKKTLAYIGFVVSAFLLIKVLSDRTRTGSATEPEHLSEATEIATPDFPVAYSLGQFDERFGISKERFLQIAEEAKKVWEDAAGKPLFNLHPEGAMKINLIFDWRQEQLLGAKKAKAMIDETGRSFDQLQSDYDERSGLLDNSRRSFDETAQTYKIRLEEYNARVARWNESKDHTDSEYRALQSAGKEIEGEQNELEKKRSELNAQGEELNRFGEKLTELAQKHNLDVESFNGRYVQSRDFEKGLYDGKAINIYEFDREDDLKLALVHEFGHAIGMGHVENPKAIMYRKLAVQDLTAIRLTSDDLNLLLTKVK